MIRVPAPRRAKGAPVEPTPDERRNGWTPESLGRYLAERQQAHREPDGRGAVVIEGAWDRDVRDF